MRQCGECSLCCKLLPVRSLGKKADTRCQHQRHTGCRVYSKLMTIAPECRLWNCAWIVNEQADDLSRPDRSHYVIDVMPDYVTIEDDGRVIEQPVSQIWVDPKHPDAHKDPALRDWIERSGIPALIRYSALGAFVLIPPALTAENQWIEKHSENHGPTHSAADVLRVLGLV